jgi:hypothetical protein
MPFPKIELKAGVPTLGSGHRCRVQPLFHPDTLTNTSTLGNLVKAKQDPKEGMAAVNSFGQIQLADAFLPEKPKARHTNRFLQI